MADPAPAPAQPDTPSPPPAADAGLGDEKMKELAKAIAEMRAKGTTKVDLSKIVLGPARTRPYDIPSGLEEDGKELTVEVPIIDLGDDGLLGAYSLARQKNPQEAAFVLLDKCVPEPNRTSIKDVYAELPTRFQEGLTARILKANGIEGFLELMSILQG